VVSNRKKNGGVGKDWVKDVSLEGRFSLEKCTKDNTVRSKNVLAILGDSVLV